MTVQATPQTFPCEVREVFSGDDLIAMVDLGVEGLHKKVRIRLSGVDTPNAVNSPGTSEAGQLRTVVRQMTRSRKGQITVVSRGANSWVVVLEVDGPEGRINVNDYLIAQGYEFKKV